MNINLPKNKTETEKRNQQLVLIDAIGVSIANVASPFLPVFLARMGATNFQVGLLSSMPGVTGLLFAILAGRFLHTQKNTVPWLSLTRLLVIGCYTLTGVVTLVLPQRFIVNVTLFIWAMATFPSTILSVAFSVVMNAVAGPKGRLTLLSRRWAIFGLTGVLITFAVTRLVNLISFPKNYGLLFIILSIGGLFSFFISRMISIPDQAAEETKIINTEAAPTSNLISLILSVPAFVSFSSKSFVYLSALALSVPIMPLYYVHNLHATDGQIGTITMTMTSAMLIGYFFWPWVSQKKGGRFVLLATSFGMIVYPALTASTLNIQSIYLYTAIAGIFQAGLDLVFFDELMKTVPPKHSAIFVSVSQSMQYLSAIIAPMLGAILAEYIGLGGALFLSAALRLIGFILFLKPDKKANFLT